MLELSQDQYYVLFTITTYISLNNKTKWSYYFIISLERIKKSYLINIITNMLNQRFFIYLLFIFIRVIIQNIKRQTIYSILHITSIHKSFCICTYIDKDLNIYLKKVNTIIFNKISM